LQTNLKQEHIIFAEFCSRTSLTNTFKLETKASKVNYNFINYKILEADRKKLIAGAELEMAVAKNVDRVVRSMQNEAN
jgi:hypothetical protein